MSTKTKRATHASPLRGFKHLLVVLQNPPWPPFVKGGYFAVAGNGSFACLVEIPGQGNNNPLFTFRGSKNPKANTVIIPP